MVGYAFRMLTGKSPIQKKLKQHFGGVALQEIVSAARTFPIASKVDVQVAVDNFFTGRANTVLLGIHSPLGHETPTLAHLFTRGPFPVDVGPLQHDEIDIGELTPARCLKNGLWLSREGDLPFVLLLSPNMQYGRVGGVHIEMAVPKGEKGLEFSQKFFRGLGDSVNKGGTYRGRVISLRVSTITPVLVVRSKFTACTQFAETMSFFLKRRSFSSTAMFPTSSVPANI
jgi:hypothetical protein